MTQTVFDPQRKHFNSSCQAITESRYNYSALCHRPVSILGHLPKNQFKREDFKAQGVIL